MGHRIYIIVNHGYPFVNQMIITMDQKNNNVTLFSMVPVRTTLLANRLFRFALRLIAK